MNKKIKTIVATASLAAMYVIYRKIRKEIELKSLIKEIPWEK